MSLCVCLRRRTAGVRERVPAVIRTVPLCVCLRRRTAGVRERVPGVTRTVRIVI